jgi:hypothetical protein
LTQRVARDLREGEGALASFVPSLSSLDHPLDPKELCRLDGRVGAIETDPPVRFAKRFMSRWVLAFVFSTIAVGCVATSPLPLRPEAEVTATPLSAWVDIRTLRNLAALAAKDRVCLDREARYENRKARSARQPPVPSLHGTPYGAYTHCMYSSAMTACDATADDLRTLKTLLNRDPRLEPIASFETLVAQLKQECGWHDRARNTQLRGWDDRHLQHCDDQLRQPLLITQSILLRSKLPDDWDEGALWSSRCHSTPGSYFLNEHCRLLQRRNQILARKLPTTPPQVAEQGVEAYFCPRVYELLPPREK